MKSALITEGMTPHNALRFSAFQKWIAQAPYEKLVEVTIKLKVEASTIASSRPDKRRTDNLFLNTEKLKAVISHILSPGQLSEFKKTHSYFLKCTQDSMKAMMPLLNTFEFRMKALLHNKSSNIQMIKTLISNPLNELLLSINKTIDYMEAISIGSITVLDSQALIFKTPQLIRDYNIKTKAIHLGFKTLQKKEMPSPSSNFRIKTREPRRASASKTAIPEEDAENHIGL
jgi:hypothetical protein